MECVEHNHQSDHGVCPFCLRHELSRLLTPTVPHSSQRISPSPSSSSSSSASPEAVRSRASVNSHRRAGSMSSAVREAVGDFCGSGLKKSRSVAFGPRECVAGDSVTMKEQKKSSTTATLKKSGFWTKLLPLGGKRGGNSDGGFFHMGQMFHRRLQKS